MSTASRLLKLFKRPAQHEAPQPSALEAFTARSKALNIPTGQSLLVPTHLRQHVVTAGGMTYIEIPAAPQATFVTTGSYAWDRDAIAQAQRKGK